MQTSTKVDLNANSRVVVVGTSGAGKTTLAGKIAATWNLTDIELDALFWEPDWEMAAQDLFFERIRKKMQEGSGWVIHGNYRQTRDLYWKEATHLVWLDYSFFCIFMRVFRRSVRRIIKKEILWNGNREGFVKTFLSRDSIIWWMVKTYKRRKKEYSQLITEPESGHLKVIHLTDPKQVNWFKFEDVCSDLTTPQEL